MSHITFSDTCNFQHDDKNSLVEAYLEPLFFKGRQFNVEEVNYDYRATEVMKKRDYISTILKVVSYVFVVPVVVALAMKVDNRLGPEFSESNINRPDWNIYYLDGTSKGPSCRMLEKVFIKSTVDC